ncbi:MAG: recombinase family protein [Planctomycetes bacterium]|nr:recombinase family protein [Planctomycetota bacterium]
MAASLRGEWTGGTPPYGYMIEQKRLVPNPSTAPIIRRIFDEYASGGTSLRELADKFNSGKIPAPAGKMWRFTRIRKYLSDDLYLGVWTWPKNPDGRYHHATADGIVKGPNTRKARGYRTCKNPIVIPDNHEPLVEKATFDRCQQLLSKRPRNTSPYKSKHNPYRLAGLLKCAHCGSSMIGILRNYRGHPEYTNRSYVCSGYTRPILPSSERPSAKWSPRSKCGSSGERFAPQSGHSSNGD